MDPRVQAEIVPMYRPSEGWTGYEVVGADRVGGWKSTIYWDRQYAAPVEEPAAYTPSLRDNCRRRPTAPHGP